MTIIQSKKRTVGVVREVIPLLAIIYIILDIARINYNVAIPITSLLYIIGFLFILLYIPNKPDNDLDSKEGFPWIFTLVPLALFILILNNLRSGLIFGSFAAISYAIVIWGINSEKK